MSDLVLAIAAMDDVMVLDNKDGLDLYHYTDCSVNSPKELWNIRGVIFDTKSKIVVCQSFPYTPEYTVDTLPGLIIDYNASMFYNAFEGTVIRLFHHDNKWYLSTHRKIDAKNSKWSGPSFLQIFQECLANTILKDGSQLTYDQLLERLDVNNCYVFLAINHPQNQIACNDTNYFVKHLVTFARTTPDNWMIPTSHDLGFTDPASLVPLKSYDDLIMYFEEHFPPSRDYSQPGSLCSPGLIVFPYYDMPYKIVAEPYRFRSDIRGNEPFLRARYLRARNDPVARANLQKQFPNPEIYNEVESQLHELATLLHRLYRIQYISHTYLEDCPKEEYVFLRQCHTWYQSDTKNNKIFLDTVKNRLNDINPVYMNRMLKRLKKGTLTKYIENNENIEL